MKMLSPLRLGFFSLLVILVAVIVSFPNQKTVHNSTVDKVTVMDETMTQVKAKRFHQGNLSHILELQTWRKNKEEDIVHFEKPVLTTLERNGSQWQISAHKGQGLQKKEGQFEQFSLEQDVIIDSYNKQKQQQWHLLTDFLSYYPNKKTAHTSHEVRIEGPEITIQAKGMTADFNQHTIKFIEKVNANYAAAKM
jgi:LPS export ABC transporter protein LptC